MRYYINAKSTIDDRHYLEAIVEEIDNVHLGKTGKIIEVIRTSMPAYYSVGSIHIFSFESNEDINYFIKELPAEMYPEYYI